MTLAVKPRQAAYKAGPGIVVTSAAESKGGCRKAQGFAPEQDLTPEKQNPGLREQTGVSIAETEKEKAMTEMYQGPSRGANRGFV